MNYICSSDDILENTGVCALFNQTQIAIFRVKINTETHLFAIDNFDPFSGANVLARGIVGAIDDQFYIASPMYKQRFNLKTGVCLDQADVSLKVYPVDEREGKIYLDHPTMTHIAV